MKLVFFGAGQDCSLCIDNALKQGLKVDYIVDNDSGKHGSKINEIPVWAPTKLQTEDPYAVFVIITTSKSEFVTSILKQLRTYGYSSNVFQWKAFFIGADTAFGFRSGFLNIPQPNFIGIKGSSRNILVFDSNNGNRIYRCISDNDRHRLKRVFDVAERNGLFASYIVPTKISDRRFDGLAAHLVFEHEWIPVTTYIYEWSPKMIKDYVLFMIDFLERLDSVGLCLKDAHSMNATYHNGKFIFFDFDSIDEKGENETNFYQFIVWHMNVLFLFSKLAFEKAYMYLRNFDNMCTRSDIVGYLSQEEVGMYDELLDKCLCADNSVKFGALRSCVEYLSRNIQGSSRWQDYQSGLFANLHNSAEYTHKQTQVIRLIRSVMPKTLLDLAGNQGIYSMVLHEELDYAITIDLDLNALDFAYKKITELGINNVYPVYLNLVTPSVPYYKDRQISADTAIQPWRKGSIERIRCQMVLALAVVHHLIFGQQLSFEESIGQFALFTSEYLIVEFIERSDITISEFLSPEFEWYTQQNFEAALEVHFEVIEKTHSEPTRILYLCKKKVAP